MMETIERPQAAPSVVAAPARYHVRRDRDGYYLAHGPLTVIRLTDRRAARELRALIESEGEIEDVLSDVANDEVGERTRHRACGLLIGLNGNNPEYGCGAGCVYCQEEANDGP